MGSVCAALNMKEFAKINADSWIFFFTEKKSKPADFLIFYFSFFFLCMKRKNGKR